MQNFNSISFQKGVDELKQMFPNLDEDIIICVLVENDNLFEKALDVLLAMQIDINKIKIDEPEISIFSKGSSIVDVGSYSTKEKKNVDCKVIQSSLKETIISKKENEIQTNKVNGNKIEINSIDDSNEIKKKNSFGQKFKNWMNNIFKNKRKKSDNGKIKGYETLEQNEN